MPCFAEFYELNRPCGGVLPPITYVFSAKINHVGKTVLFLAPLGVEQETSLEQPRLTPLSHGENALLETNSFCLEFYWSSCLHDILQHHEEQL